MQRTWVILTLTLTLTPIPTLTPTLTLDMELESVVLNEFNEGETKLMTEFYIDGYEIPSDKTSYVWFAFNFDDDSADEVFVVVIVVVFF